LFKGDHCPDSYVEDWRKYLVGETQLYEVAGDHMKLREEPYVRGWADTLKTCLEAAQVINTPPDRKLETVPRNRTE